MPFFDTCVDSFYTLSVNKNRHFLTPPPPSSCPRSPVAPRVIGLAFESFQTYIFCHWMTFYYQMPVLKRWYEAQNDGLRTKKLRFYCPKFCLFDLCNFQDVLYLFLNNYSRMSIFCIIWYTYSAPDPTQNYFFWFNFYYQKVQI